MSAEVMQAHFERYRQAEIDAVRDLVPRGARVLEVGGGSGFHAAQMTAWGCDVTSVDLAGRPKPAREFHAVMDYDGRTLPFADASFDVVFSSNVLEHVADLDALLAEMLRVLKAGGRAVHVVPGVAWRFWTIAAHYPYLLKRLLLRQPWIPGVAHAPEAADVVRKRGWAYLVRRALVPGPHGEHPSAFVELVAWRRGRWQRRFEHAGFIVEVVRPTGLFATGYGILPGLGFGARRGLARVLGSSGHVFVLAPGDVGKRSSRA